MLLLSSNIAHTADKRILVEQFTSAGTGYCVDGTYILDELIKKYPDKVIVVNHHINDGMSTEQSQTLYNVFGASSLPTAALNRLDFTGKVANGENPYLIDRTLWLSNVQELLKETPAAEVLCSWYYDEIANKIKVFVISSLVKNLSYQQSLNAVVIENNVVGSGAGFDQKNSYAGLKGYEKHPYYNKPATIVGFQHNSVERLTVAGLWGDKLNIKKTGFTGESYQWSFVIDVPKTPSGNPVNMNNVDIIGYSSINETNKYDILNCAKGIKEIPKTTFLYSTNGTTHYVNDKVTINMKIDNQSDIDNNYDVVIETQGYGAKNWLVNVEKSNFAINSGQSASFNIDITPKSQGMKKIRVVLKDKDNNTFYSFTDISVYNTETEKLAILNLSDNMYKNLNELDNANINDFIWLMSDDYSTFGTNFPNSKLILMDNSDFNSLSVVSPTLFNDITSTGKKLFIIGNKIGANSKSIPKLLSFWSGLGFKYNEQYTKFDELVNNTLSIKGYKGDPISDGSQMTLIPSETSKEYSTYGITDFNKVRPVYSISKDPNSIISFRTLLNNQRVLFSAFNFFNIQDEDQRFEYINKSIDWLMDGLGEDQPHLSILTKNLNFNLVELGKSDTMGIAIKNNGNKSLQLTSQTLVSETSEYVVVQPLVNKSVNPGDSIIYQIRFTPISKNQSIGYFFLKANDPYRDSIAVTFSGKGRTSVEDDLQVHSTISISPNPVTQSAQITVFFENNMQNVIVNLIDIQGRPIKQISNGDFLKGNYKFNLSTDDLNSGSYFIQMTNDVSTLSQPIIINK